MPVKRCLQCLHTPAPLEGGGGDERKATLNPEAEPGLGNAQEPGAKTPNRTHTPIISTPSARMLVGIYHR